METIALIAGARPNFMKLAPLMRAIRASMPNTTTQLIHTGQHYDQNMSQSFFEDLALPKPDVSLGIGSGIGKHCISRLK